jgi:hypothetical protein
MISVRDRKQEKESRIQNPESRRQRKKFFIFILNSEFWILDSLLCFLFSVFCFLFPVAVQACSVCGGSPDDPLGYGINRSIVFLMTMPFAVFGSIGGWLFYTYHKANNKEKLKKLGD